MSEQQTIDQIKTRLNKFIEDIDHVNPDYELKLYSYQMKSINIFDYAIELLLILRNKSIVTKIMFNHKEYHLLLYLFKN